MKQLALVLVAACGSHPPAAAPPAAPPPAPPAPRELEVGISVTRSGGAPIKPNDAVPTRTDFAVALTLSTPAFVYVGGLDAAHASYPLAPKPNVSAELPAGRHRIPEVETKWLVLEPPVGAEVLYVIASQRALPDVDASLAQLVGEAPAPAPATPAAEPDGPPRAPKVAQRKKVRDAPDFATDPTRLAGMTPRGVWKARKIGEEDLGPTILSDRAGVVVYLLPFSQVPVSP